MPEDIPSYDDWLRYCFTQGRADFCSDAEEADERTAQFFVLDSSVLAGYLIRLFRDPTRLLRDYNRKQLAEGVWFIFGSSEYVPSVVLSPLPVDVLVDFYDALGDFYLKFFDLVCSHELVESQSSHPDPLDVAVFMIWDMDGLEYGVKCANGDDKIVDAGFRTLERVLSECKTSTCQESALHGLGHLLRGYEDRSTVIIERFLASKNPPKHVVEYAREALEGLV